MKNLGIAVTKLTSRFGILSRKASMRLATETGKRLFDKSQELGRKLEQADIEKVFEEVLPKKCRPKILTNPSEGIPYWQELGLSEQQAKMYMMNCGAQAVPNIKGKRLLYIPIDKYDNSTISSVTAHELEHTLELDHRFKKIIKGFKNKFLIKFKQKFLPKSLEKDREVNIIITKIQNNLQRKYNVAFGQKTDDYGVQITEIASRQGYKSKAGLLSQIRSLIRNSVVNPKIKDKDTRKKYEAIEYILDCEKPAYRVQGEVEKYAGKSKNKASAVANIYDAAEQVIKQERKIFLKNKLLGRLKTPQKVVPEGRVLTKEEAKEAYELGIFTKEQYETHIYKLSKISKQNS